MDFKLKPPSKVDERGVLISYSPIDSTKDFLLLAINLEFLIFYSSYNLGDITLTSAENIEFDSLALRFRLVNLNSPGVFLPNELVYS